MSRARRRDEPPERRIEIDRPEYPAALRHVYDPPPVLWVRGARTSFADRAAAIAVVGARDATADGMALASRIAAGLAERGITVVSGLARGIDAAAHRGALDAGGDTVAVVGCGTDVIYPWANAALRAKILARGCVLSELSAGEPPLPFHFPRRNRIISGLCLGVVVVEAGERSGSLVTARHALEQGREVFAVPGPAGAPRSRGPHLLLKRGAKLVETVDDVLEEFPDLSASLPRGPTDRSVPDLLAVLLEAPLTADGIAARLGRQVSEIWTDLLDLELAGKVSRGPGGRFVAHAGGRGVPSRATGLPVDSPDSGR